MLPPVCDLTVSASCMGSLPCCGTNHLLWQHVGAHVSMARIRMTHMLREVAQKLYEPGNSHVMHAHQQEMAQTAAPTLAKLRAMCGDYFKAIAKYMAI